ncbi:hypothetical protein T03_16336 [Trichinella britovi]|uniref:Uncharacterized protein n=1 Tax=Trichinella britovi TaxID=45882 RepID=A0A0V1AW68_TRIBR|nr:hypothetical protein T03_16336 [Trichinella britovi]
MYGPKLAYGQLTDQFSIQNAGLPSTDILELERFLLCQ